MSKVSRVLQDEILKAFSCSEWNFQGSGEGVSKKFLILNHPSADGKSEGVRVWIFSM